MAVGDGDMAGGGDVVGGANGSGCGGDDMTRVVTWRGVVTW